MKKRNPVIPFIYVPGKEKEVQLILERYCAYAERSVSDVKAKLRTLKVPSELHQEFLETLVEQQFLDEKRFGDSFVRGKFKLKGWGKIKIKAALGAKSVEENIIRDALEEIPEEAYKERLAILLEKKVRLIRDTDKQTIQQKLFRYAAQKGYETSLIFDWINAYFKREE